MVGWDDYCAVGLASAMRKFSIQLQSVPVLAFSTTDVETQPRRSALRIQQTSECPELDGLGRTTKPPGPFRARTILQLLVGAPGCCSIPKLEMENDGALASPNWPERRMLTKSRLLTTPPGPAGALTVCVTSTPYTVSSILYDITDLFQLGV